MIMGVVGSRVRLIQSETAGKTFRMEGAELKVPLPGRSAR